jgi:hypothetical protein
MSREGSNEVRGLRMANGSERAIPSVASSERSEDDVLRERHRREQRGIAASSSGAKRRETGVSDT